MSRTGVLLVALSVTLLTSVSGAIGPATAPAAAQQEPAMGPPPAVPPGGTPDGPGVLGPDTDATATVPPPVRITLASIDTAIGAGIGDLELDWSLLIEHAGTEEWPDVEVTAQLHAPVGNRSALRAALAGGGVPAVLRTVTVTAPGGPLAPGSAVVIAGTVDLTGIGTGDLGGVHPLRLRVVAGGVELARVDTAVVRLQVPPPFPLATTVVWPISEAPARGPDGGMAPTFDVATAPGGRLATLIAALERAGDRAVVTLAPAPHLVEDLARRAGPVGSAEDSGDGVLPPPTEDPTQGGAASAEPPADVPGVRPNGTSSSGVTPAQDSAQDGPSTPGPGVPPGDPDGAPAPDAPAPTPEAPTAVDDGARQAARLLDSLRRTVTSSLGGPVTAPYADADVSRLLAGDPLQRELAARALQEGSRRLEPLLGRTAHPASLIDGPADPRVLDLLPDGVVLLAHAAVTGPDLALDEQLGEPVRELTSPTGRQLTGIVADPFLSDSMGVSTRSAPGDPVLAAHQVLVDTAMVLFEAPGRSGRSLLLMAPVGFDPDPRFAAALLDGLARAPWLRPSTPSGVVAEARGDRSAVRLSASGSTPLSPRLGAALAATEQDLRVLAGAVDLDALASSDATVATGGVPAIPVGTRTFQEAEDELLRASSRHLVADSDRSVALLEGVRAGVDGAFGGLRIGATDLTLTAREGTLPITLTQVGGVPIRVRLEVEAPAAITWTAGTTRDVTLAVDAGRTLELPLRTGSTGQFPITVTVTDPTGERTLAAVTLSVRGTAVSGPALALIGGAIVALTIVGTVRQRRRGRHGAEAGGQRPR
jgi:hypothetical protein